MQLTYATSSVGMQSLTGWALAHVSSLSVNTSILTSSVVLPALINICNKDKKKLILIFENSTQVIANITIKSPFAPSEREIESDVNEHIVNNPSDQTEVNFTWKLLQKAIFQAK